MRQYTIKLNTLLAILAIMVMTFSFMGGYEIFYGKIGSLQWYFFYYGRFLFMLIFVVYSYCFCVITPDSITRKWLWRLLLTPVLLMFMYSCVLWILQHTRFPYISRGISDTMFMVGSYLSGISLVLLLKEKTIKYGLISAIITFVSSCILGVLNCGLDFFKAMFGENNSYTYYVIHNRYLELHEVIFTFGLYLICLMFTCNEDGSKKQISKFLITMICFILGGKRIGFAALGIVVVLGTFLKRKSSSNKVRILSITGTVGIVLAIIYVSISTSTKLVSILSDYGIDMMGRDIIYRYFRQFCEFSPTFLGKGVGFVTRQFDYTTSADLYNMASIRALHNDYMKVFIEIGFFGFILWVWYWIKYIPKVVRQRVGVNSMVVCFLLITYAFVTYLTDNTAGYFNFQLHLVMLITSIACGYTKYKYDKDS